MSTTATKRDTLVGGAILVALAVTAVVYLGAVDVQLPDVQEAKTAAKAAAGAVAGIAVAVSGGALVYVGVRQTRGLWILLGALLILIGLPLVGITVGLPAPLQPLFGLLQLIVDLLNKIIGWI